jgi:hypothetical protein
MHMYTFIHMNSCTNIYLFIYMYYWARVRKIHALMYMYTFKYMNSYIHIHLYINMYTYIYIRYTGQSLAVSHGDIIYVWK